MKKLPILRTISSICLAVGLGAGAVACTAEETGDSEDVEDSSQNLKTDWLYVILSSPDEERLLEVLDEYDTTVGDAEKLALAATADNQLLSPAYVRLKRATLEHKMERFEKADKLYEEALAVPDQPMPKSFIRYEQTLARHGAGEMAIVSDPSAELIADLKEVRAALKEKDSYSGTLDSQIGIASFVAGTPDLDILLAAVDAIDLSETLDVPGAKATTMSITIAALVNADRREEALKVYEKLVRLDRTYHTGLSTSGIGAQALNP